MGGYEPDSSHMSKEEFFGKQFLNSPHVERFMAYDNFLRKHLNKQEKILSIASGRCVNELSLLDDGYKDIMCSDLEMLPAYLATKALFPDFRFIPLNILESPASQKYDAVIALSLIYLFDEQEFDIFLKHVMDSVEKGGTLILDSAGSPDNFLSFIIHDIVLKFETYFASLKIFIRSLGRARIGVTIQDFGYRRTDKDIIKASEKVGLKLIDQKDYVFLNEFRRSKILRRLVRPGSFVEKLFVRMGKRIPYTRMFYFRKPDENFI